MNVAETLVAQLEREANRVSGMILAGSCSDYVSYRELIAQLKALEFAIETANKVLSGDEDED
jgi:hypothetical protein